MSNDWRASVGTYNLLPKFHGQLIRLDIPCENGHHCLMYCLIPFVPADQNAVRVARYRKILSNHKSRFYFLHPACALGCDVIALCTQMRRLSRVYLYFGWGGNWGTATAETELSSESCWSLAVPFAVSIGVAGPSETNVSFTVSIGVPLGEGENPVPASSLSAAAASVGYKPINKNHAIWVRLMNPMQAEYYSTCLDYAVIQLNSHLILRHTFGSTTSAANCEDPPLPPPQKLPSPCHSLRD